MTAAEATRPPESAGVVLGITLGLGVILAAILVSLAPSPPPPDGAEWLAEHFDLRGELPFGCAVTHAERFVNGQVLVLLGDPAGAPEDPPPDRPLSELRGRGGGGWDGGGGDRGRRGGRRGGPPRGRGGGGGGGGGRGGFGGEWTDWSKVAEGSPAPPLEIGFTRYPRGASSRVLSGQFASVHFRDLKSIGGDGGELPADSGYVDWAGYEAAYVRTRHFYKAGGEPTFHDSMRVNLTLGKEATVLHLRWPRRSPGSLEDAQQILAVVHPRIPADA